jgi:hypothetical protein
MTPTHEKAVTRFRLRLALALALKYGLAAAAAWAFAWGTAVLVLRAAYDVPRPALLWGLAALPAAVGPAVWLALRRLPSRAAVRALLDRHSGCGGLLMAAGEAPLGAWGDSLPPLTLPRLRWAGGRACALLAFAVGFVLLGLLLPQSLADLGGGPRLEVGREAERLAKKIDVLKEEAVLDAARADALKDKLEQVRREASGKEPVKTLEALDHLEGVTAKAGKEAAAEATRQTEQLAKAEALAEALGATAGRLSPKRRAEAMGELAARIKKAAADAPRVAGKVGPDLAKALEKGDLGPAELKRLAEGLRAGKEEIGRKLAKLQRAGLIDEEALRAAERAGETDPARLAALLKEKEEKAPVAEMVRRANETAPERVNKQTATSGLAPGEKAAEADKFREKALPPEAVAALKDTKPGANESPPTSGRKENAAPQEAGRAIERLGRQLDAAKAEALVGPKQAEEIARQLSRLKEKAPGQEGAALPPEAREAMSRLAQEMGKAGKDAAAEAARRAEQLAKAEALAEALRSTEGKLPPDRLSEAMKELASRLGQAAAENEQLRKQLGAALAKALESGALDPEMLKQAAEMLRGDRAELLKKLGRLQEAGLLDPKLMEEMAKSLAANPELLASMLKQAGGKASVAEMVEKSGAPLGKGPFGDRPGRTGMTFGEKSSEAGVGFKDTILPPAAKSGKGGATVEVGSRPPERGKPGAGPAQSGALGGAAAAGGSANAGVVLPRHRGAVGRYFERPAAPPK